MWLPISVHMAERTRVSSWQGPLRGVTLGVWFWSPPGNDSSASGTSRPVLLGWNKMAFLGVAQARPSADVLSPRTVENSKASPPAASPIDIPETLVRQAIAGLTSSSSSHG